MTTAHLCDRCGIGLTGDAPGGLCPSCLGRTDPADARTGPELPGLTGAFPGPVPPPPAALAEHFPSIEILGLLGQGGMGTVYKARQFKLDRLVALKVLSVRGASAAFAERFIREARALARLNHPHIVTVHDFGEAGPFYYFLMELGEGGSLRDLLRAGRLPPEEALAVVAQACDALQYAHDEGIVHRDIKPDNLLLDRCGRLKVADFGLARLLGPAPAFTLTGSQLAMGTLHYMAPEQWETPHSVDHRADIYSLGVVLYELLTGELPLGRFPLPSQKAAVDPRLDDVVLRALEKDPQKRYQRAADLRADVEAILGGRPGVVAALARSGTPQIAPPAARLPAPHAVDVRREALELARAEVSGPATGLLLAGVLSTLLPVVFAVVFGVTWLGALMWLLGVPFGVVMTLAAHKMRRLEAPELALVGSILAVIPVSPAWAVGLPIGIWALLVLRKPEVQAAFATPKPDGPATAWPRWLPRSPVGWTITLCALGLLTTVLPWVTQPRQGQDVRPQYAPPGLFTWPGLAVALLFLLCGCTSLVAQRAWTDSVRRRAIFLRTCLRFLLALAGLGMLLFLGLILVVVGPPQGVSGPKPFLAGAWLAFAVLLMATWFVHGRNWQPVTTILSGLAIAVVVLLTLDPETAHIEGSFIAFPSQGGARAVLPHRVTCVPLLALALAAGLVMVGARWRFSMTRVRRPHPGVE